MESSNTKAINQILEVIDSSNENMLYTEILNKSPLSTVKTAKLLKFMLKEELVSGQMRAFERIGITPKGEAQLIAYREQLAEKAEELCALEEQMRKDAAIKEAEKRSDRRNQFFHDLLMLIIGSALTLIVEHFPTILSFFASFFD